FSPTGSMATARANHTATLLSDGRVLVIGSVPPALASAELYDPKSGTFSPTGSMTTARSGYTATLLSDGRVLVTGGKELASAELYDPRSGTFSPTGSMATAREGQAATLLSDGRVLVTGGQGEPPAGDPTGLASAELYDPRSGTFSPTGPMSGGRVIHTATLLADGRILVTGGLQTLHVGGGFPLASADLYDPKSGTFSPTGSMATARDGYTATLLSDGRVLVAGGTDLPNAESASGEMLASAELYDPTTGTFSPTGSMATARVGQTATTLADGRVLVTGGVELLTKTGPGPFLASADRYDPTTGTFSAIGP
ncbi:MAG TPA: kelch repeat-containing protein, partial [Candidatus Limnocylindrales bacterium]